ncbi:MAG: hypothetical protein F6K48_05690 [Okeania sp. SIO3H1]|uniref:hypothetical protein n=1 Tax=Okeania sp. SIO1I7 TaxID=2607772 RepID=UPI0013C94A98|nr:hypothetical protein [Okeania sp. SIO1I7]NEN88441.1 hypothetical protein [Okeania sp. SIO3H1]NET27265.1 hypothetical protein [Okeania sp. SIO1I7]
MGAIKQILMGIVVATSACVLPNHSVNATSLINFEPVDGKFPDGSVAVDNMPITDQFSSLGVTFGIDRNLDGLPDAGLFPRLEAVGNSDPVVGFYSTKGGGIDIAAPGFEERLGSFFLRGVGSLANEAQTLIINC